MAIIKVVKPEEAQGVVKEAYAIFEPMGMVPTPMLMLSSSPFLLETHKQSIEHMMKHPTLNPGLLALIRMLVAEDQQFYYCIALNRQVLAAYGIADEDAAAKILADPASALLAEKDKAMLLFVLKAVKTPDQVTAQDMENLRQLGWTDGDILEATSHGTGMVASGIMFKVFKMEEGASC